MRFKEISSGLISRALFRVLSTIELDHQAPLHTTKVGYERTNGMLAAEFSATQLAVTQLRPKFFLGVGNIISQLTGTSLLMTWIR